MLGLRAPTCAGRGRSAFVRWEPPNRRVDGANRVAPVVRHFKLRHFKKLEDLLGRFDRVLRASRRESREPVRMHGRRTSGTSNVEERWPSRGYRSKPRLAWSGFRRDAIVDVRERRGSRTRPLRGSTARRSARSAEWKPSSSSRGTNEIHQAAEPWYQVQPPAGVRRSAVHVGRDDVRFHLYVSATDAIAVQNRFSIFFFFFVFDPKKSSFASPPSPSEP